MEAEKSVIGSVLRDAMKIDKVAWLEPRDFQHSAHSLIWTAIKYLYKSDKKIDIVSITEELHKYKRLNEIGGVIYLHELANNILTTADIEYHAKIVRENAIKRRVYDVGYQISALSNKPYDDLEEMFAEIEKLATSIRPAAQGDLIHVKDAEDEYFDYLDKQDDFIKTGFKNFDNWIGGLGRGWLYVLAARPSVGKTAKMLQMLRGIAAQGQGQCLVWSQEMKRPALTNRMMASIMGIPLNKFRLKQLTTKEKELARKVYQSEIAPLPIRIADAKNVTIEEVAAAARQAKRENGQIAAIFVDYLGIMNIPQPLGMSRQQAIGQVTQAAKRLAMELDCVFILLAQMNREGKRALEPSLEHLRESGDIEQDADVVEFLWENPEDTDPGKYAPGGKVIQSIIAKGRDVGVNRFRYGFYGAYQQFIDLPPLERDE
ncbi:DnaB-like helicase C-terminal domain-containing protein [Thermoactinomyces sp. CICC 10521]|uniref:replicative DNA helicase n=1 Tax=Thermoactinomyces sp. CICC 10521 TaxID=2767426 RepID=UPI0018DE8CF1|nr:DnaB-like helicase C-terminal domain-containing protein [Thermoactinomyces sp. CICC 10521]MBH8609129.1 AAA family ATPase [Thermoactinomyces sp. CICC 10521]